MTKAAVRAKGRPRRRAGDVVKVSLRDGTFVCARVLEDSFEFYGLRFQNGRTKDTQLDICKAWSSGVLFRLWVMDYAVTSGRWPVVGELPLDPTPKPVHFFKRAMFQGNKRGLFLLDGDGNEVRPATPAECRSLEYAAVWDPEHVEERLRDHFAGRPNWQVERTKVTDADVPGEYGSAAAKEPAAKKKPAKKKPAAKKKEPAAKKKPTAMKNPAARAGPKR